MTGSSVFVVSLTRSMSFVSLIGYLERSVDPRLGEDVWRTADSSSMLKVELISHFPAAAAVAAAATLNNPCR